MSQLFPSGGQNIGVSASTSVPPWTPRTDFLQDGLVGSPCSPRDSQQSCPTPQFKSINSLSLSPPYSPTLISIHDYWKTIALTRWTFVDKVMSLLFNMLSRLVITFLPRSKRLFISWLQSPSEVILKFPKIKSATVSTVSPSISHEVMGLDAMILGFWMLSFTLAFSLSSFIKRLFSSSFSAIRMVSSAYLRLLIYTQWIIYYLSIKMNKIMSLAATWMDLVITTFKWNKSKIISQTRYDITYVSNPKKKLYKWIIYKTETDSQT